MPTDNKTTTAFRFRPMNKDVIKETSFSCLKER